MQSQAGQVDKTIDRAQQVIGRNVTLEAELVEQRLLHHRPLAHHRLNLLLSRKTESVLQDRFNPDFFNTIGHDLP